MLRKGSIIVLAVLALTACGSDEPLPEPLAAASPSAAPSPSPSPSPTPSPSPSPSPSPAPLSPFEDDPAVQGLRAFYLAAAQASNAGDLRLPALVSASTPERAEQNPRLFAEGLQYFSPGPLPFTPTGVRRDSPTQATIPVCLVSGGWDLVAEGGEPATPDMVIGASAVMRESGGVWRLDTIRADQALDCSSVTIVRKTF